jgi:CheY-like chemotaxis protein
MLRVLAFEDTVDIEALLLSGGVDMSQVHLTQHWTTEDALSRIEAWAPDVLLLDHFIPPATGLEVLRAHLDSTAKGSRRAPTIVAMSSEPRCNAVMVDAGADGGVVKHRLATLPFWPRATTGR